VKPRVPVLVTKPARPALVAIATLVNTSTTAGVSSAYKTASRVSAAVIFFRGTADHQASQEHGNQCDHDHAVQAGSQTSEDDFANLHVQQKYQRAHRLVGTMH
jgi:hypothetical protein